LQDFQNRGIDPIFNCEVSLGPKKVSIPGSAQQNLFALSFLQEYCLWVAENGTLDVSPVALGGGETCSEKKW
jgi:NADPH-dependent glutamate synthase beta subunit-like oxidoreductase